eukprot:gene11226-12198_t
MVDFATIVACAATLASSAGSAGSAAQPSFPSIIKLAPDASTSEVATATFLQQTFLKVGVDLKISSTNTTTVAAAAAVIAVGFGAAVEAGVPSTALIKLGGNDSYILAAASPAGSVAIGAQPHSMRGALLGASKYLSLVGFDFIAPDETTLPALPLTQINASTFIEYTPAFEYRDSNEWSASTNNEWAGVIGYNGQNAHGHVDSGHVSYASPPGFVHTSYNLIAGEANGFNVQNCARIGTGR